MLLPKVIRLGLFGLDVFDGLLTGLFVDGDLFMFGLRAFAGAQVFFCLALKAKLSPNPADSLVLGCLWVKTGRPVEAELVMIGAPKTQKSTRDERERF